MLQSKAHESEDDSPFGLREHRRILQRIPNVTNYQLLHLLTCSLPSCALIRRPALRGTGLYEFPLSRVKSCPARRQVLEGSCVACFLRGKGEATDEERVEVFYGCTELRGWNGG